uniref:Potassium channel domain-containing protein n=1 Tax=Plectus sambesii TaxID=2011161 RepID=A0A914VYA4_9BILA
MLLAQLLRTLCLPGDLTVSVVVVVARCIRRVNLMSGAADHRARCALRLRRLCSGAPSSVRPPPPSSSLRSTMLTVYGAIVGLKPSALQRAKPITFHFTLVICVLLYAFLGGIIFHALESEAYLKQEQADESSKQECVLLVLLNTSTAALQWSPNRTSFRILECWHEEDDMRTEWSYVTATLYGFGIVTTLGYNRINPITIAGRMFCIVYGLCGIPMAMIILANVGQYLNQFACNSRKRFEQYSDRRRRSKALIGDEADNSVQLTSLMVLVVFLLYVALGAVLLPLLNGKMDFLNGLYYNFLCLTAIDFGALVPKRVALLPITLTYVCIGLAITTLAIDVGSEYMKKLHYLGKKMKDAATTRIWFGGKSLKVSDLLHAVGKKLGIDPQVIDNMDLDNVVERAIAIQEGRPLPPEVEVVVADIPPPELEPLLEKDGDPPKFIDDEPPAPPADSPPASDPPSHQLDFSTKIEPILASQLFRNLQESLAVEIEVDDHIEKCPSAVESPLALHPVHDLEQYPLIVEYPLHPVPELSHSPIVLLHSDQIRILIDDEEADTDAKLYVEPEPVSSPDLNRRISLQSPSHYENAERYSATRSAPQSSLTSPLESSDGVDEAEATDEFLPKRFREKKEMYGRDPRKLFQTYQEEWDRLERLNAKRTGGRRKSVLSFH